jgi:flagellar basal-body rod protein FlgB
MRLEDAMSDMSDAAIVEALRRHMAVSVARQTIAASNLANLNTPGYRAREVDFDSVLDRQMADASRPVATHPRHLSTAAPSALATREADGLEPRRDGNTVQLDHEVLSMSSAAGDFAKAQTALAAKFRLVRYAINEGR